MATQQKALLVPAKFAEFVVGSKSIPKPGPGELLVKIRSTSLNPADWKIHKYGLFIEEFPAVLGLDLAGDVEEVGEGVTTFVKGDRVCVVSRLFQRLHIKNPECSFAQGQYKPDWATFQQYAKTDAATTSKVCSPTNLNLWSIDAYSLDPSKFLIRRRRNSPCRTLGGVRRPLWQ